MLVVAGVRNSGKRVSNRMMAGIKIIAVAMIPFSIAGSRALPFHDYERRSCPFGRRWPESGLGSLRLEVWGLTLSCAPLV